MPSMPRMPLACKLLRLCNTSVVLNAWPLGILLQIASGLESATSVAQRDTIVGFIRRMKQQRPSTSASKELRMFSSPTRSWGRQDHKPQTTAHSDREYQGSEIQPQINPRKLTFYWILVQTFLLCTWGWRRNGILKATS